MLNQPFGGKGDTFAMKLILRPDKRFKNHFFAFGVKGESIRATAIKVLQLQLAEHFLWHRQPVEVRNA